MKSDKITGVWWLFFGLLLTIESYRLDLGSLRRPDSGLYPFIIGILLVSFSLVLLIKSILRAPEEAKKTQNVNLRNIILCLISLFFYALIFEWLGFILSTFLLILFLLKIIEKKGWIMVVITALLTSVISYLFFDKFLHAALPRGIFGF